MKISVIIPCHNNAQWLAAALNSVEKQTLPARQVIVVLDSSSDESHSIAQNHPVKPEILHTRYGNAASARNAGVDHAKCSWVAFLDADDWWVNNHLETAALHLALGKDAAYFGNYSEFWQNTSKITLKKPLDVGPDSVHLTSEIFYNCFLGHNPGWPTSGMVINTQRFREVNGFDTSQLRRHDTELFARVIYKHTWAYNAESVFFYRKDIPGSISTVQAQCSYYRLLADIKICNLYGAYRATTHLRNRAELCLSETLRAGADFKFFKKAIPVCLPLLDPPKRICYFLANLAPSLSRSVLLGSSR